MYGSTTEANDGVPKFMMFGRGRLNLLAITVGPLGDGGSLRGHASGLPAAE